MNIKHSFAAIIALAIMPHLSDASTLDATIPDPRPAPAFDLPDPKGRPIRLDQFAGKVVYLDFWASWCGPCRQSFPWMNQMQEKYAAQGLVVLGVNLDAKSEDALTFLSATPIHFQTALDPKGVTPKAYGVKGMPSSFLIGRNGKILFRHTGFKASQKEEIERHIIDALGSGK